MTATLVRCFTDAEILELVYASMICGALAGFALARIWK
jgi:hypothetical protein